MGKKRGGRERGHRTDGDEVDDAGRDREKEKKGCSLATSTTRADETPEPTHANTDSYRRRMERQKGNAKETKNIGHQEMMMMTLEDKEKERCFIPHIHDKSR